MGNYILHLYCMSRSTLQTMKIKPTTWYFESLKCVIPMPKHDSHDQNNSRVCTSITIAFPTANAPFEIGNAQFQT